MTKIYGHHPHEFYKIASLAASSYGFAPIETLLTRRKLSTKETRIKGTLPHRGTDAMGEEICSVIGKCVSKNNGIPPVEPRLFYHLTDDSSHARGQKAPGMLRFGLTVLGSDRSLADAFLIKTAVAVLEELGIRLPTVYVNSIGDRDSTVRFIREITSFLRRNAADLPVPVLQASTRDSLRALELLRRREHPLYKNAPRPFAFLSERSRRRLKEVLEYLESTGISYEIDEGLLGHRGTYTETIFEIRVREEEKGSEERTVVRGGRCDELARKMFKFALPAVGALFEHEHNGALPRRHRTTLAVRHPKVYFIQLGFDAGRESLKVVDLLRRAHIPLHQSLSGEKLAEQLNYAARLNIPYTMIMGQREALDGSVIVRNMQRQSQETVPFLLLAEYFKRETRA